MGLSFWDVGALKHFLLLNQITLDFFSVVEHGMMVSSSNTGFADVKVYACFAKVVLESSAEVFMTKAASEVWWLVCNGKWRNSVVDAATC